MDTAGAKLLRSLQTVKFNVEELRRQEKDLPPADGTSVHATQAAKRVTCMVAVKGRHHFLFVWTVWNISNLANPRGSPHRALLRHCAPASNPTQITYLGKIETQEFRLSTWECDFPGLNIPKHDYL